jgi:hypothetical protein
MAPGAPRPNRTAMNPHLKNQMATTAPNQVATEKANTTAHMQIKVLTDLVTSLLRAMEEQKQAQANQIETLTQQIDALRVEGTDQIR